MSHEDCQGARYKISCQQGRTLLLLLTLLTTYVPGQLARTVIIGQGRKIIADLGERPVPQLAPRPRSGEEAFLLSGNCVSRQTWTWRCASKEGKQSGALLFRDPLQEARRGKKAWTSSPPPSSG